MLGNKCALRAAGGNPGRSRSAVWLAHMVFLSGRITWMPSVVGWMLVHGLCIARKFLVQPVSNMALDEGWGRLVVG